MKTTLSLLLISTIFLTSCGQEIPREKKFYETALVTTGSISGNDRVIAMVEGKNTVNLSFKTSGRIMDILVKPGDKVKKWQILAVLGNEEGSITAAGLSMVFSNLSGISESIDSLYASRLDNLENDAEKARIGVQIAEKDLSLAKLTLSNSTSIFSGSSLSDATKVSQAEKNLEYAQNNLQNSTKLLETQWESMRRNALSSMSNAFIIARNARDFVDETLGVTNVNKTKNDAYEVYLGAKNIATKTQAENFFNTFNTEYESMYTWYYSNIVGKTDISKETLHEALTRSLATMENLRDLLHALSTVLENTIISSNLSDNDVNILKNKTTTFLSNLELTILDNFGNGIKGSIAAIDAFDSNYILKIQQLQDAINLVEEDLNLAKTGKDTSSSDVKKNIDILTTNIGIKENTLELAKVTVLEVEKNRKILESERDSKLQEMKAKISETQMNHSLANNTIESGIIYAPFDGVILTKDFDIGSIISPGSIIVSMTSTDGILIKTNVDLIETPLTLWQKVSFSRLSDGIIFDMKVSVLRTEPDQIHNKGYTELIFTGTGLSIGERGEVLFEKKKISKKEDIIIPHTAIITKYGETGVYIMENGQAKYSIISIIATNGNISAITWLHLGQKVITKGKENILDGEKLE